MIMRALLSDLSRLYRVLSLTPREKPPGGQAGRVRERLQAPEAPIHKEILRAQRLICRIESTGVKFPVQIYDALEQARKASEQNCWTLQMDRNFYSALSLLEQIARRHGRGAATHPEAADPSTRSGGNRGWTVIISNSQKVLDGDW
jgi:hypothetical protein